jgi:hypothetical protein
MCDALVRHGCEDTIVRWIRATLQSRVAVAALNETSMGGRYIQGLPSGRHVVTTPMVPGGKCFNHLARWKWYSYSRIR